MNDYHVIHNDITNKTLTSRDTLLMHKKTLTWLNKSLLKSQTKKNIVVTHHAPSNESVHDRFKNNILSTSFASNLDKLILKKQPDLWIHGHVHDAFDYMIGETRVLCNSKGYPNEPQQNKCIDNLIIEI